MDVFARRVELAGVGSAGGVLPVDATTIGILVFCETPKIENNWRYDWQNRARVENAI